MVRRSGTPNPENGAEVRSAELTSRWSGGALCGTPNSCAVPSSGGCIVENKRSTFALRYKPQCRIRTGNFEHRLR